MLRIFFILPAVVLWVMVWFVPVLVAYLWKKNTARDNMVMVVCRGMVWLVGMRLQVVGTLSEARPLLVVSNHISYLDIIILGSVMPCRFTPKKEIAKWPVINIICKMLGCIFVDRAVAKIETTQQAIGAALQAGEVVAVFPEATTGDGKHLLPFKPALFEVAAQHHTTIQPVAIIYRKIRNLPIAGDDWPTIAWYGDMLFLPHLLNFLSLGRVDVMVKFLPSLSVQPEFSRKTLAELAQNQVAEAIEATRVAI